MPQYAAMNHLQNTLTNVNATGTGQLTGGSLSYWSQQQAAQAAQAEMQLRAIKMPPRFDNEIAKAVYDVLHANGVYNPEALANAIAGEIARIGMNEAFDLTMKIAKGKDAEPEGVTSNGLTTAMIQMMAAKNAQMANSFGAINSGVTSLNSTLYTSLAQNTAMTTIGNIAYYTGP